MGRDATERLVITARRMPSFRLVTPRFGNDPLGKTFAIRLNNFVTSDPVRC